MCFHSKQSKDAQSLEKRFKAKVKDKKQAVSSTHFNGFDFPKTPIITNIEQESIQLYEWGLLPTWAKDDTKRHYTLNARIETLDEKPSFQHHQTHRCLVLSDGFYEWKWLDKSGRKKEKFEIQVVGQELFAFAGVWSTWVSHETGECKYTYTVVTTEAQGAMREINNHKLRMPVVLQPDQEQLWLAGEDLAPFYHPNIEYKTISLNPNRQQSLF